MVEGQLSLTPRLLKFICWFSYNKCCCINCPRQYTECFCYYWTTFFLTMIVFCADMNKNIFPKMFTFQASEFIRQRNHRNTCLPHGKHFSLQQLLSEWPVHWLIVSKLAWKTSCYTRCVVNLENECYVTISMLQASRQDACIRLSSVWQSQMMKCFSLLH